MTKKFWIKIWIVLVITCVMSFSDWSFAEDLQNNFETLANALTRIASVTAWLWVFLANLAWTFLTNKWIYGEELGLDILLWKFWNLMKNMANFWLWFYFVYTVFKWLIEQWKEDITKKLKGTILWLLIAWVWIQASRFITAAIIDVSTVTLVAAGSFPSQVISGSPKVEDSLKKSISSFAGTWLSLFPKNSKASSFLVTFEIDTETVSNKTDEEILDTIAPNDKDVAWPLYFIWYSLLETYKLPNVDSATDKWLKKTILNVLIQRWTTIVYAIEMLVLCVFALIRIIYMWMFIVLSPVAILLRCIEKSWWKKIEFMENIMKQIKIKVFLINTFKPTIIVLCFWVALIFVALMKDVVLNYTWGTIDMGWSILRSQADPKSNINSEEQTYTTSIANNLLSFTIAHAWKTLLELVLCIITVMIVYYIIKFALTMWEWDFVTNRIKKVQNWVENLISKVPVVPVASYDKEWAKLTRYISAGWISEAFSRKLGQYTWVVNERNSEDEKKIRKLFGDDTWYLTDDEMRKIKNAGIGKRGLETLTAKKNAIVKSDEWKWMTLNLNSASNNWFWITEFTDWLNERVEKDDYSTAPIDWQRMINSWKAQNPTDKTKRNLEQLFNERDKWYANTYAKFFGYTWWNYTDFNSIKDLDISKN